MGRVSLWLGTMSATNRNRRQSRRRLLATMTVFIASPRTTTLRGFYMFRRIEPSGSRSLGTLIALTVVAMIILDRIHGLDRLLVGCSSNRDDP